MKNVINFPPRLDIAACFRNKPAALDFVLPGFLTGTVGLLTATSGTGKSLLSIQLAAAIAIGHDKMGLGINKSGDVLFLVAEDPILILQHRLHDMRGYYSEEEYSLINERVDFRCVLGLGVNIMSEEWYSSIAELSKNRRLVILDTLSRFHSLDENFANDAKELMRRLEKIAFENQCAVLVLHHVNKASGTAGTTDMQQAARGSSVFVDNARWASFIAVMTNTEAKKRGVNESDCQKYVRFNINKQNYSAPINDIWLKRGVGGVLSRANFDSEANNKKPRVHKKASNNADDDGGFDVLFPNAKRGTTNEKWY